MKTRLRNLREDNDLTQKDLSKMLNISQVAYSYYELNKRSIPLELLSKIADFYHTSVDYLLFRTNIPTPYPIDQHKNKSNSIYSKDASNTTITMH